MIRPRVFGALLVLAWSILDGEAPLAAWPVLDEAEVVAGVRVLPDHEDPSLFWTVDDRLRLAENDGRPSFQFDRIRYTGRSVTGDRGKTRGRGLIRFTVRSGLDPEVVVAVEEALKRQHRRTVRVRPMPVSAFETRLIYATTTGTSRAGSLSEGRLDEGNLSGELSYTVGLDALDTDLFWSAYEQGGIALSLNYSVLGRVLAVRPGRDREASAGIEELLGEDADRILGESSEPEALVVAGGALPIAVAPSSCPSCFTSIDLDAFVPAEYAYLEVRCLDFETGAAPDDLIQVLVEVRATAINGERPFQRIKFSNDGRSRLDVHFPVAVELDQGYEVRRGRVFLDGHVEFDDWEAVPSWSGVKDVTRYTSLAAATASPDALDPRQLY